MSLGNSSRQTNGKKKLKGSLALMVGRARKPASAGADTSTKVTAVERRVVLSLPECVSGNEEERRRAVTFTILACGFSKDPYLVHFTSITRATGSWQESFKLDDWVTKWTGTQSSTSWARVFPKGAT